ncbi:ATP-dependent Clp protease ATP-binding subunit ClpX [Bienertia sinuspersici]
MRVGVDVRKPLLTVVKVKMRGGVEESFEIKYEKPPLFCSFCGRLGHGGEEENLETKYGVWLKASPWKSSQPIMLEKEGSGRHSCAKPLFTPKPKARGETDEGVSKKI